MTPSAEPAVWTEGLGKSFRRRRSLGEIFRHPRGGQPVVALDGVSLEVRPGEIFGLLGPNGAGKTTLLKVLSGLVLPDRGRARVGGADIAREEMAVRRAIGYVTSDERSFYWRLTGAQNLTFFARLFHVPEAEIPVRVERLLERMELSGKARDPFSAYSSGMKQRLAIARALLHDPPIVFLDEPTRSLDPVTARHIREFVREGLAGADGKTVLLATHNLHEAADLCHRMAILIRGRVRRTGRLEDFRRLFAAGRRYAVTLDRPVNLDGVARVREQEAAAHGGPVRLLLEPRDGDDLTPLLAGLARGGVRVLDFSRQQPTLEDLFDRLFHEGDGEEA